MRNNDPSYDRRLGTNKVISAGVMLIRMDLKWGWRVGMDLCGSRQGLVMDASELAKQLSFSKRILTHRVNLDLKKSQLSLISLLKYIYAMCSNMTMIDHGFYKIFTFKLKCVAHTFFWLWCCVTRWWHPTFWDYAGVSSLMVKMSIFQFGVSKCWWPVTSDMVQHSSRMWALGKK
jgi:hypothetical protein